MPRSVRPVWMDLRADGGEVGKGPKARNGSLNATLYVRERGEVAPCLSITAQGTATLEQTLTRVTLDRSFLMVAPDGKTVTLPSGSVLWAETEQ